MKIKALLSAAAASVISALMLTGCASVPANSVFSVDDLNGKSIGVQLGTTGDIYASSDVPDATVERFNKGADAVQALKQGKVDAVLIDVEPAKVFVANNDDLMILDDAFAVEEYAVAIKKGNDELTEKINGALAQIASDGTLDAIKSNWIGEKTGKHPYTSPENVQYTNGTIVMATNAEFPPYESMSGEEVVGFDVDMMKAVCDVLGMELKIDNMEFDSIIAAVDSGKADVGAAGMTITKERLENVNFSDPYTTATQVVIVRKK